MILSIAIVRRCIEWLELISPRRDSAARCMASARECIPRPAVLFWRVAVPAAEQGFLTKHSLSESV